MGGLFLALGALAGLGSLICFILVLVKMFQNDQTGLGIACIVLTFCVGIGPLIAFIYGWMNAGKWEIKNIMQIWTACFIGGILFYGLAFLTGGFPAAQPGL